MPTTIYTDSLPNSTGGFNSETFRNELPITAGSLGQVRVTFKGSGAGSIADHCSIGVSKQDGTGSTTATPIELKFSGVSGFSVGAGVSIVSDWANLSFASTDLLMVIWDSNASNAGVAYDTVHTCYTNSGTSYNTATVSGFTTNSFELGVGLIETQAGAGDTFANNGAIIFI